MPLYELVIKLFIGSNTVLMYWLVGRIVVLVEIIMLVVVLTVVVVVIYDSML